MRVQIAGIPWYRREEYEEILTVMEDAHLLPTTFDAWLKKAKQVKE